MPEHIERQLRMLSAVVEEVKAADQQLRKLAGEHAVCRRLMTVPGVGPLTALRFVAAIDEQGRFATARHVQSYLGLTPGEHSSSERFVAAIDEQGRLPQRTTCSRTSA